MRATYKFLAQWRGLLISLSTLGLVTACCWLVSFYPFEKAQPLSKAESGLAGCRACPLRFSCLSHWRRHDRFQYRAVRRLFSAFALNLRTATGGAHFRVAVLH